MVVGVGASFSNRAPSRCGDCGQAISWWSVWAVVQFFRCRPVGPPPPVTSGDCFVVKGSARPARFDCCLKKNKKSGSHTLLS